jgi:hypothetical protein
MTISGQRTDDRWCCPPTQNLECCSLRPHDHAAPGVFTDPAGHFVNGEPHHRSHQHTDLTETETERVLPRFAAGHPSQRRNLVELSQPGHNGQFLCGDLGHHVADQVADPDPTDSCTAVPHAVPQSLGLYLVHAP